MGKEFEGAGQSMDAQSLASEQSAIPPLGTRNPTTGNRRQSHWRFPWTRHLGIRTRAGESPYSHVYFLDAGPYPVSPGAPTTGISASRESTGQGAWRNDDSFQSQWVQPRWGLGCCGVGYVEAG